MYSTAHLDAEYQMGRRHARKEVQEIIQRHIRKAERSTLPMSVTYMLDQILTEIERDV